jgi:chemotaxis protein methyltransferase WspC
MKPADALRAMLERRLGLRSDLIGADSIERALTASGAACGAPPDPSGWTGVAWDTLVDELTVRETWFFRDLEPFRLLAAHVTSRWLPSRPEQPFRVLSIPCATGEEPYSVAITLLDAGLAADRIRIDAGDISEAALARARLGVYGKSSFREKNAGPAARYFEPVAEGMKVRPEAAALVRFEKANLLDLSLYRGRGPYDAIFCRNSLIYLTDAARLRLLATLGELLDDEGLLFTGHSEVMLLVNAGFRVVEHERGFACLKPLPSRKAHSAAPRASAAAPPRPKRGAARPAPARIAAPEPPGDTLERAAELADLGDIERAAAICERLLARGDREAAVYALLGLISESSGKLDSAEEMFRTAVYLDPHHYESLLHLGLLAERRGDADGSRRYRIRAARALERLERPAPAEVLR